MMINTPYLKLLLFILLFTPFLHAGDGCHMFWDDANCHGYIKYLFGNETGTWYESKYNNFMEKEDCFGEVCQIHTVIDSAVATWKLSTRKDKDSVLINLLNHFDGGIYSYYGKASNIELVFIAFSGVVPKKFVDNIDNYFFRVLENKWDKKDSKQKFLNNLLPFILKVNKDQCPEIQTLISDFVHKSTKGMSPSSPLYSTIVNDETFKNYIRTTYLKIPMLLDQEWGENICHSFFFLSLSELRIIRNSIFAKYGRKFKDSSLQNYFNKTSWYKINSKYSDNLLSDIDKKNIQTIYAVEARLKKKALSQAM